MVLSYLKEHSKAWLSDKKGGSQDPTLKNHLNGPDIASKKL